MSIASEITSMGENLKKDYQSIANLGADLTNVDKNIENIAELLDGVYDVLPKTEYQEGTEVNLGKTSKGKLDFDDGKVGFGQSSQDSTTGKNLNKITNYTNLNIVANVGATITKSIDKVVISTTTSAASGGYIYKGGYSDLIKDYDASKTYYISADVTFSTNTKFKFGKDANSYVNYTAGKHHIEDNFTDASIVFYTDGTASTITLENIMVCETASQTYEKYTGGYSSPSPNWKQPIKCVAGRNKFNGEYTKAYIDTDGSIVSSTNTLLTDYIDLNDNITISAKNDMFIVGVAYYNSSKTFISREQKTDRNFKNITYSAPSNTNYIRVYVNLAITNFTDEDVENFKIQIEEGTQATPYLPYNTIEETIGGKNLARMPLNTFTSNSVTSISQNGEIKVSGTPSQNWFTIIPKTTLDKPLPVGDYTFSRQNLSTTARLVLATYDKNDVQKNYYMSHANTQYYNFTTTDEIVAYGIFSDSNSTSTSLNFTDYIMIEKGTTTGTNYEPYFTPKTYQFSLGDHKFYGIGTYRDYILRTTGKNLFNSEIEQGGYYASGSPSESNNLVRTKDLMQIYDVNSNYVFSNVNNLIIDRVLFFDSSQSVISRSDSLESAIIQSSIIPSNTKYIKLTIRKSNFGTLTPSELINPMLEEGSTASDYQPFGVGNWYKVGKIGETIYTGSSSEIWSKANVSSGNNVYSIGNNLYLREEIISCYCNYFQAVINGIAGNLQNNQCRFRYYNDTGKNFYVCNNAIDNVNDFKTWLSTHNLEVCYILDTPTYTPITGTLAEQLEAWWNGQTLNGTTIITSNGNLPMIIKVRGLKGE